MSASGLVVDRLFHLASLVPSSHHTARERQLRARLTLALNIVATGVLVTLWFLARNSRHSTSVATDPICGMAVKHFGAGRHASPRARRLLLLFAPVCRTLRSAPTHRRH